MHVVPPPPVPRLAQPSDGPLHLLAGVPPEGVPASAVMDLVQPLRLPLCLLRTTAVADYCLSWLGNCCAT